MLSSFANLIQFNTSFKNMVNHAYKIKMFLKPQIKFWNMSFVFRKDALSICKSQAQTNLHSLIRSFDGHRLLSLSSTSSFYIYNFQLYICILPTLLTPSFGNHFCAYHLVLKHPHTNMILSSFCIPTDVKSATKFLKIGS